MGRGLLGIALLAAFAVLAGSARYAGAQIASAMVTGTVADPSGGVVARAPVTLTRLDTNGRTVVASTEDGVYAAAGLQPGRYRLEVVVAGFRPFRREPIQVTTGDPLRIDIVLALESVSEQTNVAAEVSALRTERASLGALVGDEQLARLPLNGRTFVALAGLAPGVALPPGSQLPRINGGRPRTNEYLFDGISVLQPEPGQVAYVPVLDSVQEFRIESNSLPAEFGRFNGGVVNLTTKSGTNALHGTAFEFLRHERLNARNAFQTGDAERPQFRRSQFGGTLGGPLAKDRTFFFADYQGQRQSIGRTAISTVPTALQRSGTFTEAIAGRVPVIFDPLSDAGDGRTPFPGNTIPDERIDPVARALLQRYPLPTSAGTANNYRRTDLERNPQNQWAARIDHRTGSGRDHVFARLASFRDEFLPVAPLPDGSGAMTAGTIGPQQTRAWAFASSYQRTLSGTLFNELRVGETRRSVHRTAAQLDADTILPTFTIAGYQQLGSPPSTASDFRTGVFEIADALTWARGRHTLKAGFDWRWPRLDVVQPPSPAGSYDFTSLFSDQPGAAGTGTPFASFLLGQVQTFSIDVQRQPIQERARIQEYFVQDDWKATSRLTLSPGLRYTLNFPSTEVNGQTAVFNLETQQLEYPGDAPVRQLHTDNVGPRMGLAYRATDRTILSAGYGLVWIEMTGITTPFTTPSFPFLQTATQRTLDNLTPAFVLQQGPTVTPIDPTPTAGLGQGVFSVDRDLGSGYVQQWNASLQRSLSPRLTAEVSYVGSKITRVGIPDTNLNQLAVEHLALGAYLTERVPNPFFGTIPRSSSLGDATISRAQLLTPYPEYTTVSLYRNNVGTTFYQGLEVSLRQRFSGGIGWSASYTRSKLVDDASSVFDGSVLTGPVANYPVADSFNRAGERDYSTGDVPHAFAAAATWDLPWRAGRARSPGGWLGVIVNDWAVASVVTLQSGTPVAITQATNFNAFAGFGVQRPNIMGDPELPPRERTATRWFNTAVFSVAPQFTLGTASRNPVRGPAYRNVDLSVSRRIPVGLGATLELRAEVFNLFNTTNLGSPATVLGAANFGSITSAFDPRVVQLGMRLAF